MLDLVWQGTPEFSIADSILEEWLKVVCLDEGCELNELTVVFMTDDGLLEMNKEYLQHDYYTDIITFDYKEENAISGDLFISVDRVKDNASRLKVEYEKELNRVIVHGVLHIIGYGDKSEDEAGTMRSKEDFYLNKLKGFT